MSDPKNPVPPDDEQGIPGEEPAADAAVAGSATLGPTTPPAESGRRADSLLTPDVTGGSEGFANTSGGTLLAPDVAPDEVDPNAGN